jgi:hypothetical protein
VGGTVQFRGAHVLTDATGKQMRLACDHFTTAEEPFGILFNSEPSSSIVSLGGGTSLLNAATVVRVFTATDTTTLTGTERLRVTPNGRLLVGLTADSGALFQVAGGATLAGLLTTVASASGSAGLRLPHGAAPTSPVDGDMWTTTSGVFVRINGTTFQLDMT